MNHVSNTEVQIIKKARGRQINYINLLQRKYGTQFFHYTVSQHFHQLILNHFEVTEMGSLILPINK